MPLQVTITPKPGYLHVKVTGENSPQNVRAYLEQVRRACEQHKCPDVLVEEHLEGPSIGATDVFAIASDGSRTARPAVGRIAFVDAIKAHDAALMAFAETVAVNRGLNIRIFPDVPAAEVWLRPR